MANLKIVYYMNQFFAGIGGEDKAGQPPTEYEGAVGPARLFESKLNGKGKVVKTVVCGDNYFGENPDESKETLLEKIKNSSPDIFVAGPAFGSGRHGIACATMSSVVARELKIPSVTAMHPDNPGVDITAPAYAIPTEITAKKMDDAITRMCTFALKLQEGKPMGDSEAEGYIPRKYRVNTIDQFTGAERAVRLLWNKLSGESFKSEMPLPKYDFIKPPAPVENMKKATIAIASEAGVVPLGNPDRLEPRQAEHWYTYSIKDLDDLTSDLYETVHSGYNHAAVNQDPDRFVPVDIMRQLEKEGRFGKLADTYLAACGSIQSTSSAKRIGYEMSEVIKEEGIDAVILTAS